MKGILSELDYQGKYLATKDGLKLYVVTNKNANMDLPWIVFNYGLVCNPKHFGPQIQHFHHLGHPLLVHDYRGHFNSSAPAMISDITFAKMSEDLNFIMDELKIERALTIGHSMGVNISLEFAKDHPERVIGQVLISGTVLPPQDIMFDTNLVDIVGPIIENIFKSYPQFSRLVWKTSHYNPILSKVIHNGGFNTKKVPEDFVRYYLKKIGELPPELFFHLLNEMKNHRILSELPKIKTRTLVMGGDMDKVIPNYLQQILTRNLPNSEYYLIKDGSHVPQVDFYQSVNERIELFLADCLEKAI